MADLSLPWTAVVDLYCERNGTQFRGDTTAEPLNAWTPLWQIFLGVAYLAWMLRSRARFERHDIDFVGVVLFVGVGVGAIVWHSLAYNWAYLLDMSLPMLFICWFVYHWGWRVLRFRRVWPRLVFVAVVLGVFFGLYQVGDRFPLHKYLSVHWVWWAMLFVASPVHWYVSTYRRWAVGLATAILAVSLFFYGWDKYMMLEGSCWPIGSHWLWHVISATGFFVLFQCLPPEDWESKGTNLYACWSCCRPTDFVKSRRTGIAANRVAPAV